MTWFRAGVGAVIIRDDGRILSFERTRPRGAWQLPQGGIEAGESPRVAVLREIKEETGIGADSLLPLAQARRWITYELPDELRKPKRHGLGQTQMWFLFLLRGDPDDPDLVRPQPPEFVGARWTTMSELIAGAIWFRKPGYRQIQAEFAPWLAD